MQRRTTRTRIRKSVASWDNLATTIRRINLAAMTNNCVPTFPGSDQGTSAASNSIRAARSALIAAVRTFVTIPGIARPASSMPFADTAVGGV
jgi:hypothetical protein